MKYSLFLFLFSLIPAASGYTGIFSILDEQFIDNITDLPYSAGNPDKQIQTSGIIRGWVDIVGFREMMRENGLDYVPGNPKDYAIIQYDAWAELKHGFVDRIDKTLTVSTQEKTQTAQLKVELYWHDVSCSKSGCVIIPHYSNAIFQDSEIVPQIYPEFKEDLKADITEYNNTINPHAAIELNLPGNISKVTYRYNRDTLTHYFRQGHVEQTEKGVYYLNLSVVDFWTANTESLQHLNTWVIIPNSSRLDYSKLSIEISNPYETRTINNYSFERITYNSGSTFSNPLLMFAGMISTFIIMSIKIIKRVSL